MKKIFLLSLVVSFGFSVFLATATAADKENGRRLVEVANCASCHGANLNMPISAEYPKIAGQYPDYLYHAMLSYQLKGNRAVGRNNGSMVDQMAKFSRKELEDMAAYIASLPTDLTVKR